MLPFLKLMWGLHCLMASSVGEPFSLEVRPEEPRGVVVEEIPAGSALAKAGIEPGDILQTWRRRPSPPANPEEEHGQINTAFDWMWVELEQSPRGIIELAGERDGKRRIFSVEWDFWEAEIRPWMPEKLLREYLAHLRLTANGGNEEAAWWTETATHTVDRSLACWLWLRLAGLQASQGRWEEAHMAYRSSLEAAIDPFAESVIWSAIAQLHWRESEFDSSRQAYLRVRQIREASRKQDSLAVAKVINDLGSLARQQGDRSQAEHLLQQALQMRQRLGPDSAQLAETLNELGLLAVEARQLDRAQGLFEHSFQLLDKKAPASLHLANSFNNLGLVAFHRRDLDGAAVLLERALKIKQELAPDTLELAQGLNNMAALAGSRGDLIRAAEIFQRALDIRQKLAPRSLSVANSLNNLGTMYLARGDFDLAMDYHQRSLQIRQELQPNSLDVAENLHNLGLVAERRGEHSRARDFHQRALDIRKQVAPDSLDVSSSLNSLGLLTGWHGDLDQAIRLLEQALEIKEKLVPETAEVAVNLNNLGAMAFRAGQVERAEALHQRALEIKSRSAPESLGLASSLNYLGDLASHRGDWVRAIDFRQRALEIEERLAPGTIKLARTLHDLGTALRRLDGPPHLPVVDELFGRSLAALEAQLGRFGGSQDVRSGFRASYASFYRDALEVQLALDHPATAFRTLERSRARSFLDHLAEREVVFSADIPQDLESERQRVAVRFDRIQQQLASLSPRSHAQTVADLQEQHLRLRNEAHDIEERIRRASPHLAALRYPDPLDLDSTRSALDPRTLLLSYSVGEESVELFSVSKNHDLRVDSLAIGESSLREEIRVFRQAIVSSNRSTQSGQILGNLRRRLRSLLVEPVAQRIAESDRLLIIPDGPLHDVPWGALFCSVASSESSLLPSTCKPYHLAASASVFAEISKLRPSAGKLLPPLQVAVFGDPHHPGTREDATNHADAVVRSAAERSVFEWEPLPFSRREAENIAKLYPKELAHAYLGLAATEEQAKALPHAVGIVHFATHSTLDERAPLNSAVVLSIPNEPKEGQDNGFLQAREILEQVRIDADLVVLSACETARGKALNGEGLIGLTRAFQYAGARTVMASLWKIADRTTAEFMVRFYKHLKGGMSKGEALRAVQMEFIRGPIKIKNEKGEEEEFDASAPYYWAAFQLYGDWQ